uniref:AMP-binding enzyme n=1 Tax=Sinomicrobium oceani TaxID=1150368 RepID=UPI00227CB79C
ELGEIEHALSKVPGIKQSAVIAKERHTDTGTTKYLVGYYVLDSETNTPSKEDILGHITRELPEYMIPAA